MKFLAGVFLIVGSTVGGGILGLPIAAVNLGLAGSILAIVIIWIIMTFTGLCILKMSYKLPIEHNTFFTLSAKYLNFRGARVTVFGSYLLILYLTLAAYMFGIGAVVSVPLGQNSGLSYLISGMFLIFILGSWIVYKPFIVIKSNVFFVTLKLFLIILTIILIFSYSFKVNADTQSYPVFSIGSLSFILVAFNAFGYHFIIPSLVKYYKGSCSFKSLVILLVISTSIIALLYMLWILAIFFTIPIEGVNGMNSIFNSDDQIVAFSNSIYLYTDSMAVSSALNCFQFVSMIGSFCCISIGLMDNLKDALGQKAYFKTMVCAYSPPVILMSVSDNVFLLAMSLARVLTLYIEVFVPIIGLKNYYSRTNAV